MHHDGEFYDWDNAATFDRVPHNLAVVMSQRLVPTEIMGSTLNKILHGVKYKVFIEYLISKFNIMAMSRS